MPKEDLRPVGYGLLCRWPDEPEAQPSNVIDFQAYRDRQQLAEAIRKIEESDATI